MAKIKRGDDLPDHLRCNRNDGRQWRCRRPAMEGRTLCEAHFLQGRLRQNKEPVPENLKLERTNARKNKENPNGKRAKNSSENGSRKKGKRNEKESNFKSCVDLSEDLDDALKKMNLKKGDLQLDLIRGYLNRQIEKKKGNQLPKEDIVKELKYGRLEISQCAPSTPPITVNNVKVGVPASSPVRTRFFRSKNIERIPISTMQILPSIKANVKASTKKCHWCRMCSYRVLVKCLDCKKHFFCEDCIQQRHQDKVDVKKQCPVCSKTCSCRVCVKGRSKEVKNKDLVVYSGDGNFDRSQQLIYMIDLLLPLLEQINQEKDTELDLEAKIKGKDHNEIQVHDAIVSPKHKCCCFCKACIVDVHRSCGNCFYILCLPCCRDFREGLLHGGLRDLKNTTTDRRKSLCTILWNWKTNEDGSIECPPKNLGGCGDGVLGLVSHSPFNLTTDLEKVAKQIISDSKFTKFTDFGSSYCSLCDGNDKTEGENEGLYFTIRQDLGGDRNLEHFTKHWVKGQPFIIRDVIKSELELSWDPYILFCMYLERSAKSRNKKEVKQKSTDCCEVEIGRQQIFTGGKTHANVWNEKLKFKIRCSSGIFLEHFSRHFAALMHALPLQQYINPITGILNLAANAPLGNQNVDLGPFLYISYGRLEDLTGGEFLTKLCYHAYDMVNILAYATEVPISKKRLNKVKILLEKHNKTQDLNEPSGEKKIKNNFDLNEVCGKSSFSSEVTQQSELEDNNTNEELTQITTNGDHPCIFSDDSRMIGDSDDEDLCQDEDGSSNYNEGKVIDTRGAQWDVFRREDVPKLVAFLRKYSNELLNSSYCSPQKVVHPILDECFYLDSFHKKYLKEEFDVEPWTFEQKIGEAVIIPAGCPYQVKKIKSCVNVVFEYVSPESASMAVKLSDEIRQLPVNHKAKGKMLDVKKMTIHSVNAAIVEINKVPQAGICGKIGE